MKTTLSTRNSNRVYIPTASGELWIQGRHSFTITDTIPEETNTVKVYDITGEMNASTDEGMNVTYYRVFAAVEGDDVEFYAVEHGGEQE